MTRKLYVSRVPLGYVALSGNVRKRLRVMDPVALRKEEAAHGVRDGYAIWLHGEKRTRELAALEAPHWEHEAARAVLAFLEGAR